MKRFKFLTSICCIILVLASFSTAFAKENCIYRQTFENGLDSKIQLLDVDGDSHNFHVDCPDDLGSDNHFMRSDSYYNDLSQSLYPDNYLIIGPLTLDIEGGELQYDVASLDTSSDYQEHYSVYAYVDNGFGNIDFTTAGTKLFEETAANRVGTSLYHKTLSLDAYAGQTVYIAFRHHDSGDNFALVLDNICVYSGPVPATGDTATPMLWCAMVLVSAAGIAVLYRRRRFA